MTTTFIRSRATAPRLPMMIEILEALHDDARAAIVERWAVEPVPWRELPRMLVDRGAVRARARAEGWLQKAASIDEPLLPLSTWESLGLYSERGPAWELLVELGAELGSSDRLAAQLGTLVPPTIGERHVLLVATYTAMLDRDRIAETVGALPRPLRLRLASDRDPLVEIADASLAAARVLESAHQRALLDDARRAMLPTAMPPTANSPSTQLRAAALALTSCGLDPARAIARAPQLDPHVVAIALALRSDGALDRGAAAIVDSGLRFVLSPATPSRIAGELLLGLAPAQGGPELAHLAWVTLAQLASLPDRQPCPLEPLVALAVANAEAMALEVATLTPHATPPLARRYLLAHLATLHALGLAYPVAGQGIAFASTQLREALHRIATGSAPESIPALRATVQRDGDALVIEAKDAVPLERLESLAHHVVPTVDGDRLRFCIAPSRRRAVATVITAVKLALS